VATVHEGFHEEHIMVDGGFDNCHSLGMVQCQGFLAEDVLAGLSSPD
jgi:hypothetical protein